MANNFQVYDAYGSVITIESSVFGTEHRQIVGASIIGAINTNVPAGSVAAVRTDNASVIAVIQGSVATVPVGTIITSLVSTVPSSVIVGASIFGLAPVEQTIGGVSISDDAGNSPQVPTTAGINGGVRLGYGYVFNGANWDRQRGNSSIGALVSTGKSSVITINQGSIAVAQIGTNITSIVSTVPSSVLVGASIFGQLPAGTATLGAVTAPSGSVMSVTNPAGSITSITSPAGSVTGVRTDNASVITLFQNSSILSWPSPIASVIQGTADLRTVQGGSVAILSAPGAGIRNYVNFVQVANFGPSSVLVTIADNTTSILGYTIAPAGGGSNYPCLYKAAANSPVTASINGTSSVLVSAQGFTL